MKTRICKNGHNCVHGAIPLPLDKEHFWTDKRAAGGFRETCKACTAVKMKATIKAIKEEEKSYAEETAESWNENADPMASSVTRSVSAARVATSHVEQIVSSVTRSVTAARVTRSHCEAIVSRVTRAVRMARVVRSYCEAIVTRVKLGAPPIRILWDAIINLQSRYSATLNMKVNYEATIIKVRKYTATLIGRRRK